MSQGRPSATVAAVVGFAGEARCLHALGLGIACSGGSAERASLEAQRLLAEGAIALVSCGLAGGLAPALRAGDLLLPETVRAAGSASWPVDPVWRARVEARLAARGVQPHAGTIAGSDRILATAGDKRALFEGTGALAVDMESHAVAAVATDAGIPFLVLRALADPFDQAVPQVAREALRPDGRIRIRATYGGLLRQPGQLIELARLARQSALALVALRRGARLAGPGLGFTPVTD